MSVCVSHMCVRLKRIVNGKVPFKCQCHAVFDEMSASLIGNFNNSLTSLPYSVLVWVPACMCVSAHSNLPLALNKKLSTHFTQIDLRLDGVLTFLFIHSKRVCH